MTTVKLATDHDHLQVHLHNTGTDTHQVIFTCVQLSCTWKCSKTKVELSAASICLFVSMAHDGSVLKEEGEEAGDTFQCNLLLISSG